MKHLIIALCLFCPALAYALSTTTVAKVDTLYADQPSEDDAIWGSTGCSAPSWNECIDEPGSNDGNTSYLSVTNAVDEDGWYVHTAHWTPLGLNGIDSVYFWAYAEINAGTAGKICFRIKDGDGTAVMFDTTATLTSSYVAYAGDQITNPSTSAAWTVDSLNNLRWGMKRTTSPSATRTIRVTQMFLQVFWKQLKQMDTIDAQSEIYDTYMASGSHLVENFGAATTLSIGRATSSYTGRALFFVDTSFYTTWKNYYVDSAFLDLKTSAMFGGTHVIQAHTIPWGVLAGDSDGGKQTSAVSWRCSKGWDTLTGDAFVFWNSPGADSAVDDGGRDRFTDWQDTASMAVVNTVYSLRVAEWLNTCCGFDWVGHFGYADHYDIGWTYPTLPIGLRLRQNSEALPDTQIAVYAMNHATAGNRPKIRIFGTRR